MFYQAVVEATCTSFPQPGVNYTLLEMGMKIAQAKSSHCLD